jgi:hypothetical protein
MRTGRCPLGATVRRFGCRLLRFDTDQIVQYVRCHRNSPRVIPHHAGQRPKLAARQGRALGKSFELCPGDHRVNAAAKAAIGRSNDAFPADALGEASVTRIAR